MLFQVSVYLYILQYPFIFWFPFVEASRVKEFCQNASDPEAIKILMQLMCDSHQSLHKLYECSTVNLNQIVKIGLDCGMGARLTGAG